MKVTKNLLLGAAAGLVTISAAQAADLPTRKAAPVNYVRVCDAYGAGFFYIPGTDTCLRVGGLVLAQTRIQGSSEMWAAPSMYPGASVRPTTSQSAVGLNNVGLVQVGTAPGLAMRPGNGYGRDSMGFDATGRIELDARTQTGWGTLRSFIRVQSTFGSGVNAATGSYGTTAGALTNVGGYTGVHGTVAKDFTYLDKAFIQFAGITMGRVQSFFDFYTDLYNYEGLRGSNATVWSLAYTATFNGGVSATIGLEDSTSRRGPIGNVVNGDAMGLGGYNYATGAYSPGSGAAVVGAHLQASRAPNFVANVRIDQAWGSAQIMGAVSEVRGALYASSLNGSTALNPNLPLATSSDVGWAIGGGVQYKLDSLSPGDNVWVQAIYSRGAIGYVSGNNMAFVGGPNTSSAYGVGIARQSNAYGYGIGNDFDCVFTYKRTCSPSEALAVTAAFQHFWNPTLRSTLFGSYYGVHYHRDATSPMTVNAPTGLTAASGGINDYREIRVGTNLIWSPVRGFEIGGEFAYIRHMQPRPVGLAQDAVLAANGYPRYKGTNDAFYGKLRMMRAF